MLEDRRGDPVPRRHPLRHLFHAAQPVAGRNAGVLAFDESYEMGGVAGGEGARGAKAGSLQGIAGVLLQNHLPNARVLYASATGASDVNNLAYAVRLGLWGPGAAFSSCEDFMSQIRSSGI